MGEGGKVEEVKKIGKRKKIHNFYILSSYL
jgi:hypothetical protein